MNILFTSSYTRTKEFIKEVSQYYYFKRKPLIVVYILLAIAFFAKIATTVFYGPDLSASTLFIFIPFFFILQISLYFRNINAFTRQDKESHGKEVSATLIATEDFIQSSLSTGAVHKANYADIKYAVGTKNFILIQTKAGLIYSFRKDAFEKGTKEDFVAFLKSKGISVKGR